GGAGRKPGSLPSPPAGGSASRRPRRATAAAISRPCPVREGSAAPPLARLSPAAGPEPGSALLPATAPAPPRAPAPLRAQATDPEPLGWRRPSLPAARRWRRSLCSRRPAAASASTTALGEARGRAGRTVGAGGAGPGRGGPCAAPLLTLCCRNALLEAELGQKGLRLPAARKTGTTIAGVVFKDGIVLGADTRATEGMVVADKNCSKIHFISPNIYCCGAGTAADTDMTTQLISSNLELHSLSTGRLPRVVTANRMLKQMLFRYQGYIGAALVLGGVDVTGAHLYSIYPHGSTDKLPYVTMGSGSLAAMAVFEDKYKPDMEEEEAKQLVRDAIAAGIYNDLGSGSNIDLCVISKNKLDFLRPYDVANKKGERLVFLKLCIIHAFA
uniref:proteasome endopeptidase complex n=1 Tax=Dromaius novaehollandiae TaxID=8790 RepID=A0A8C4KD03_DRONO